MNEEPVLRVDGIRKSYTSGFIPKTREVVRGVSLDVGRSEIVGFLGPNGAGKSTIMKIIVGLIHADAGRVSILGLDGRDPCARCAIGYLPENPAFFGFLTAREFLWFTARLSGVRARVARERIPRLLDAADLVDAADLPIRVFSKGMAERLGMAQALIHDPEFLILDEPMSGLDPIGRYRMRDLILGLRSRGKSVFFSTHILADVEMICDRIIILVRGEIRSAGRLRDLLGEQTGSFDVGCRIESAPGEIPGARVLVREEDRVFFEVEDERALSNFIDAVRERGGVPISVVPKRKTLEEIFIEEVGRGRPT